MTIHPSRRAFLLRAARTAAYATPAIVSLSAPDHLAGQGPPSDKGNMKGMMGNMNGMGMGNMNGMGMGNNLVFPGDLESLRSAPWEVEPPGGS